MSSGYHDLRSEASDALANLLAEERPLVMGIVNVTPDSFSDGGLYYDPREAAEHARRLVDEGVDIIAPKGNLLYAVVDGTITKVYRNASLTGNGVRLTTSDGTYFFYAHLDTFAEGITEGTVVKAGQILGTVGATGNTNTSHLHFEVHPRGGAAIDPTPVVAAVNACHITEPRPQP